LDYFLYWFLCNDQGRMKVKNNNKQLSNDGEVGASHVRHIKFDCFGKYYSEGINIEIDHTGEKDLYAVTGYGSTGKETITYQVVKGGVESINKNVDFFDGKGKDAIFDCSEDKVVINNV
jgi:hypothetical protein